MISDLQREKEESQIVIAGLKTELENLKKENKQVALKQVCFSLSSYLIV